MLYTYKIVDYIGVEDDLRGIFGVDEDTLSKEIIHNLPNMPAAEMELADRLSVDITTLTSTSLMKAKLAVLYLTAANCLGAVKINILQKETDNKSEGQRFKNALTVTEIELRNKATKFIEDVETIITGAVEKPNLLDFVSPSVDVVTGNA